jgi:hypothetical protein
VDKKVFFHILDTATVKNYILLSSSGWKKVSHRDFYLTHIREMLAQSGHEPRPSKPVGRPDPPSTNIGRLDTRHNKHWPDRKVNEHGYLQVFRNICFPLRNKGITAFLRHPEQCLIPTPQIAFCFTNLSYLVLEMFKFFEKHAQNLNAAQNNSATWDLQMGFNSVR